MVKLLICVLSGAALAVLVLHLRQERTELGYQSNELHAQIRDQQAKLWGQQMQIAIFTAPNAIEQTVSNHDLKMVPQSPLPGGKRHWIDVDPGAKE